MLYSGRSGRLEKKSLAAKINAAFSQETGKIMTMSSSEEIPLLHKTA